jgi:DNA invertase Pin-like site-specific DNA recombinase|tara:strand:+ start:89 stop:295 length:207 start_codon:yes stop_codon:yes gene_type:complete
MTRYHSESWYELRDRQKQERLEQVQAFATSGVTQTKAAKELGVSLQTLNRFIQLNSIHWPVKEQGRRA